MKFEELNKEHQEFLMYCLSDYIKGKLKREERDQVIEPTFEEYKRFFDKFDGEYEIIVDCQVKLTPFPTFLHLILTP